jgi:hypothetical protein
VLSRSKDDNKKLKAENELQAWEIKELKAQLAAAEARNQKTSVAVSGEHIWP